MGIRIERYTVAGKCTPCLSTLQRTVESNRNLHIIATVIMVLVGGKMFSYARCFLTQTRYRVSISEHSVANKNQGSVVTINKMKARQVAAMIGVVQALLAGWNILSCSIRYVFKSRGSDGIVGLAQFESSKHSELRKGNLHFRTSGLANYGPV